MSDIKIFYHICCINNWKDIVYDQISKIIYSGLYEVVSDIICFVLCSGTQSDIDFITSFGKKIRIEKIKDKDNEWFTLENIYSLITPETKFLYLHTKGVTRYNQHTLTLSGVTHSIPKLYKNIQDWRSVMEYFLILNFKQCLYELSQGHDVVGINYMSYPKHFSGNFWWATGAYYLTLSKERAPGCGSEEIHICSGNNCNYKSLFTSNSNGYYHYFNEYPLINYVDI